MSELESVRTGKCQNWKVSEFSETGKCQNWKVSEFLDTGKCQNWKVSESPLNIIISDMKYITALCVEIVRTGEN